MVRLVCGATRSNADLEKTFVPNSLSLAEAIVAFHEFGTVFLDVREAKYFQYGHIQGAVNFPPDQFNSPDAKLLEKLKEAQKVIVYCNGVGCGLSYRIAHQLHQKGIENIQVYPEGWPEWRLCRLPIEASGELKKELQREWSMK